MDTSIFHEGLSTGNSFCLCVMVVFVCGDGVCKFIV